MRYSREEIITYINSLKGYQGYVQFSDTKIRTCDVFKARQNIELQPTENGFVYEAHFCNDIESISIKQINDSWLCTTADISNIESHDTNKYLSNFGKIIMAQIWESEEDEHCAGMKVKKLKKVVFAGFEGGES
jgi:CRISPR type III-associated protein (TIGR04423 family)